METKIDKNNWCINISTLNHSWLGETFKEWWTRNCKYIINWDAQYDYAQVIDGKFCRVHDRGLIKTNLITIEQWYNEIYLPEQTKITIGNCSIQIPTKEDLFATKKDLQQLEERLTKLIEEKFGNTEQPKQDLPPFPFWVEILHFAPSGFNIGDIVQIERYVYNQKGDYLKIVGIDKAVKIGTFRVLENYKHTEIEEKKPIWETHPDWDRCKKVRDRFKISKDTITVNVLGNCGRLLPFSEALAKRQVAEIKLMEIAEKWNEGVEIKEPFVWFPYISGNKLFIDKLDIDGFMVRNFPFSFNLYELAEKSIELHKELWYDYFQINNQNK